MSHILPKVRGKQDMITGLFLEEGISIPKL